MENLSLYQDIQSRTDGDIYIGVVGPVRTGKSTFIKRFMDLLVIPNIENEYKKERAQDELPQSAAGRTIMTTEPKFVPNEAIEITLGDNIRFKTRLVDCVGYLVNNAIGYLEDDMPRMVKTPWSDEEIPFETAAELGTRKVISEHSTIGILITTDGSITDIPREDYISKIKAAAFALEGTGCILIARTDAYHTLGLDEAIARCNEAIDAGASVSFIEGCGSLEDIEYAGGKVKGHKMFAMLATGASPAVTYEQCVAWGYSLVTLHCGMRGAIRGMRECYARVFEKKSDIALFDLPPVDPKYAGSGKGMFEMFGLNEWLELGKRFNPKIEIAEHLHSK